MFGGRWIWLKGQVGVESVSLHLLFWDDSASSFTCCSDDAAWAEVAADWNRFLPSPRRTGYPQGLAGSKSTSLIHPFFPVLLYVPLPFAGPVTQNHVYVVFPLHS